MLAACAELKLDKVHVCTETADETADEVSECVALYFIGLAVRSILNVATPQADASCLSQHKPVSEPQSSDTALPKLQLHICRLCQEAEDLGRRKRTEP